jgi:hypothetical protein
VREMDGYIKKSEAVDVIVKYPYDIAGKTATAIKMIEDLPSADVVPKSEVEKLVQDGIRLGQENETLKDNNEHLAVIFEETKAEVEKLQNELVIWKQNRFNLFQRLECYETARQKVASEIFAEIETLLALNILVGDVFTGKYFDADLENDLAELKKKYTEGEQ